jgi:outer membrane immunogenic protein
VTNFRFRSFVISVVSLFGYLIAAALATPGIANAADLPVRAAPPPITPLLPVGPYNWTGIYVGINGGYGTDHFAFPFGVPSPEAPFFVMGSGGIDSHGALFGGQAGANYQFFNVPWIGNAVVGVEADVDWSDIRGSTAIPVPGGTLNPGTRVEDFGTVRGRLGYGIDRFLVYFTGGLTFATVNTSYLLTGPFSSSASITNTRTGVIPRMGVVGAGVEYALTNNLSVKAEYLYDFTGAHFESFTLPPDRTVQFGTRSMYHIARLGLNYKFDLFSSPAPIVSKY